MKKNRPHPVFYAFGFLMIMGLVYQGNPHHYFPFMNKDKDVDSKAKSGSFPSSVPTLSSGLSSGSGDVLVGENKFTSPVYNRDSTNHAIISTASSGTSMTYQKNKYGFDERVGSVKKSGDGKFEIYEKNKYGFDEKVGSIRQQSSNSKRFDTYRKNKYGFEEKTGSIRQMSNDRKEIYEKNKYGFEQKVGSMRKNSSGGYDVYRKNQFGFEERVGSVK